MRNTYVEYQDMQNPHDEIRLCLELARLRRQSPCVSRSPFGEVDVSGRIRSRKVGDLVTNRRLCGRTKMDLAQVHVCAGCGNRLFAATACTNVIFCQRRAFCRLACQALVSPVTLPQRR